MSSSLEVTQNKYGEPTTSRYGADEAQGLVESGQAAQAAAQAPAEKSVYQDDEGILPVILEDYLERAGMMDKLRPYINSTGQIRSELVRQLLAEFWGTLLFQMFGGSAPARDTTAPAANGFALCALIYAFANVSGGHLNPAVSFALMCTGHMKWWKSLMYMCSQILGAIFGCLIYTSLIPTLHIGAGSGAGCFGPSNGTTKGGVFGWETMMTFLLVLTVYAAAVAKPGHGNTAPLAIGLSLYAAAISGGQYTGASLNPARTIGPAVVFQCNGGISVLYVFSEFFGAACAAGLSIFLYGRNPSVRVRGQGL